MRIRIVCACSVMAFICATATAQMAAAEPAGSEAVAADRSATKAATYPKVASFGDRSPIAQTVEIQRHYYSPRTGEGGVVGERENGESYLVYSNTGGSTVRAIGVSGRSFADDVTTITVGGCHVSKYEILVGVRGSEGGGDPYTVDFGLYDACPGATPPGQLVPGTEGSMSFDDDGLLHLITVDLEGSEVKMESSFWVFAKFTGNIYAGWVAGTPADEGFTQDVYDTIHPTLRCSARFQGTNLYAGFYIQIWCNDDPPPPMEFLAYYNPRLDAPIFAAGANEWVMDDVELIVEDCELSSFEVAVIGLSGPFTMNVELWNQWCDPAMVIEGTQRTYEGRGDGYAELARFEFLDEQGHGVPVNGALWIAWQFDMGSTGPIISGEPVLGENEDLFGLLESDQTCSYWWFGGNPYAGFNATIRCLGEAPRGACCDMTAARAEEGFCRDSTQFACEMSPVARWAKGKTCDDLNAFDPPCGYSACCLPPVNPFIGSEGCRDLPQYDPPIPCTVDEDCPRLDCPEGGGFCETALGPPIPCFDEFDCPPGILCNEQTGYCETGVGCGDIFERISCQSDEDCPNHDCDTNRGYCLQEVEEHPAVWARGMFCDTEPQKDCVLWACRYAEGSCAVAHPWPEVGCDDPVCCNTVCRSGPLGAYCCEENWDLTCVNLADQMCEVRPPNDECVDASEVVFDEQCWNQEGILCAEASNALATLNSNDPGFCCHPAGAGTQGAGSLWYYFVAPEAPVGQTKSKVKIDTCASATGEDSLVEVYEVQDWDDPCNNLRAFACNDDGDCSGLGESPTNSKFDVFGLNPGETYYIQLASKNAQASGKYKLKISPTYAADPPNNNYCDTRVSAAPAPGTSPFDLENTTLDCPSEALLPMMWNDVWFEVLTFAGGLYVVTTCPATGAGPDTTLAVYGTNPGEDECPVSAERRMAANDNWGGDCGSGSRVVFKHPGGIDNYIVRIGGENGSEPSGMLTIGMAKDCNDNMIPDECDIDCEAVRETLPGQSWEGACHYAGCGQIPDCNSNGVPDGCDIRGATSDDCQPNGVPDECDIAEGTSQDANDNDIPDECEGCPDDVSITFQNPPDGFFDARQPHPVDDAATLQGIDSFVVTAPDTCCSPACWSSSETEDHLAMHPGLSPPNDVATTEGGGGTCTITLDRAIAHGEVTTLTYTSGGGSTIIAGAFTYHPADANNDGTSTPADITALIDSLNGTAPLPDELADMDRDGVQGPADILRLIDLLNGAGEFEAWNGV